MKMQKGMKREVLFQKTAHTVHFLNLMNITGHIIHTMMDGGGMIRFQNLIMKNRQNFLIIL